MSDENILVRNAKIVSLAFKIQIKMKKRKGEPSDIALDINTLSLIKVLKLPRVLTEIETMHVNILFGASLIMETK